MDIEKCRGKSKIASVNRDQFEELLRVAVIDAVRWKLYVDDALLNETQANYGQLKHQQVSKILAEYGIGRNFVADRARPIAEAVNSFDLTDDLNTSKKSCLGLAKLLKRKNLTSLSTASALPISAASKLLWFRFPKHWTMFDRYSSKALVPISTTTGIKRFESFCEELHNCSFLEECSQIENLKTQNHLGIPASKILDKYLFLIGQDNQSRNDSIRFLSIWIKHTVKDEYAQTIENFTSDLIDLYAKRLPMSKPENA